MTHLQINQQRRAGVLLHPTSFPSGQLDDAFRWLDWMADAGLRVWQVLPLGVPQAGLSPYQCLSAFAANGALLGAQDMEARLKAIDTEALAEWRQRQAHWIEDFALFMVLRWEHNVDPWYSWPDPYRTREPSALAAFAVEFRDAIEAVVRQQYLLYTEWQQIMAAARERDILLFGDMPIFVAHDSADVWSRQDQFMLDAAGQPTMVTGVPPDYFSETGQRWGNPHYDWEAMQKDGFSFWIDRLHYHFEWFDLVRLDHFRGLEAVWMIPAENDSAIDGEWVKVPGDALLQKLQQEMGSIPLVAEDLGIITPEVVALRQKYQLPGMAVLQFGFDAFDDNPHKPHNIHRDCIVFTGTHDNDTTQGWYDSLDEQTRKFVRATVKAGSDADVVQRMVKTALDSKGSLAMIPLQDLMELGSEARMNTPGTVEDNWAWKFDWQQLQSIDVDWLRKAILASGRMGETNE